MFPVSVRDTQGPWKSITNDHLNRFQPGERDPAVGAATFTALHSIIADEVR